MELSIKDLSNLLSLKEKDIHNLIKLKDIPYQTINDKLLFNKQKIVEWAILRNLPLNISNHNMMSEFQLVSLSSLLTEHSFFYNCELTESNYIEQIVHLIDLEKDVDKGFIVQLLKNREELMSTAIGNGISLPHPRIPLMLGSNKPVINIFFPKNQLNLKSIDGKPVHTIILLISQTIKQHLSLLLELSFLLSKEPFHFALENRLNSIEILDIMNHISNARS